MTKMVPSFLLNSNLTESLVEPLLCTSIEAVNSSPTCTGCPIITISSEPAEEKLTGLGPIRTSKISLSAVPSTCNLHRTYPSMTGPKEISTSVVEVLPDRIPECPPYHCPPKPKLKLQLPSSEERLELETGILSEM